MGLSMIAKKDGGQDAGLDEQAILDILTSTLLAGRLTPGLRLGEQQLAATFGVTRERVRKVLQRLGHQRLIDLQPNRGAFVAEPGLREAREVYLARRILEMGVVSHLSSAITEPQIRTLTEHLERERRADDDRNHSEAVRLSGMFHTHLAEMTGNEIVVRHMQELVSRTAMLVAYHEGASPRCTCDEHGAILAAIECRDASTATREMNLHLSLIETRLQTPPVRPSTSDLDAIVIEEVARWKKQSQAAGVEKGVLRRAPRKRAPA